MISIGLCLCALSILAPTVDAQAKHTSKHRTHRAVKRAKKATHRAGHAVRSGAEIELLGVRLFDSSLRVIDLYGSPDEIQAVTFGTTQGGGGGFGGGGGGGFGGPGGAPGARGGGKGPNGAAPSADVENPFQFENDVFWQGPGRLGPGARGGPGMSPGGPGGGPGMGPGGPGMGPGGPGGSGGKGVPGIGGGEAEHVQYTRWIYNRNQNKYGFVIDKNGRVVQIEAIGITNPKVRTRRGIMFGSTFAQIIKDYANPDGYEISGSTLMVKYLINDKVAFRLSQLGQDKPHTVTGIVISAGKA